MIMKRIVITKRLGLVVWDKVCPFFYIGYAIMIFGCLLVSCKGEQINPKIVEDVSLLNKICPISAGKIGALNYAEIKDSCVTLHYYLTEEMKQLAWNTPKVVFDERLQYIEIALLDTTNLQTEPLTKIYFDAFKNGYSIKNQYHFKFDNGIDADVTYTILIPRIFLNKYHKGNMKQLCMEALKIREANENKLYKSINHTDSLRSYDIIEDSMFVIAACVPSKDYLHVWFNQYGLRKNLLKAFQDPSMKTFAKQCIICDKGICFRYVCLAKKDSFEVNFSQRELKHLLTNYNEVIDEYNMIETIVNSTH